MKEFFMAALPWVVIGICIVLLIVNHSKQKADKGNEQAEGSQQDKDKKSEENHMTDGMCIGMCMGVVLGTTGVVELGTGISLGMLLGLCVGMCIKK